MVVIFYFHFKRSMDGTAQYLKISKSVKIFSFLDKKQTFNFKSSNKS